MVEYGNRVRAWLLYRGVEMPEMSKEITDTMVDAALDAWYLGEDWRAVFRDTGAKSQRRDMRAALEAALVVARK